MQKENVLFITDKNYVDYQIPGGVQICTEEFISYLELAGYHVIIQKVLPKITFLKRLKLKLGIETYELYDVENYLSDISQTITSHHIKLVLFNQLNISHWATKIRARIGYPVKCIGLSHGNESGDYLYEITKKNRFATAVETWRLGKLIALEKRIFSEALDGVVVISEQESYINQWLGAKNIIFLPRILKANFLNWKPENNVIGLVGTLDHYPNYGGIVHIADELKAKNFDGKLKIIGGPTEIGENLEKEYKFISYCGQLNNEDLLTEIATWSIFINPI
ncbi:MAG: glycosyltransferase family 1 protein, partial [Pedobacter sp.]